MKARLRRGSVICVAALMSFAVAPRGAAAQGNPEPLSFKFNTGQDVYPIFEGWSRNPDGTFEMLDGKAFGDSDHRQFGRDWSDTLAAVACRDGQFPGLDSGCL